MRRCVWWRGREDSWVGKGDGSPGAKSVWLGLQRLDDIAMTWVMFHDLLRSGKLAVSSKHDYG